MPASLPEPDHDDQLARLRRFRQAVYDCFTGWADTLFEAGDALLCVSGRLESLPHLTLQPELRRGHGSVYAALAKGRVDTDKLRRTLAGAIQPEFGLVFAADVSAWHRPDALTCPERTLNYDSRKDPGGRDRVNCTTPGWAVSWLAQIGPSRGSWVTRSISIGPAPTTTRISLPRNRSAACSTTLPNGASPISRSCAATPDTHPRHWACSPSSGCTSWSGCALTACCSPNPRLPHQAPQDVPAGMARR